MKFIKEEFKTKIRGLIVEVVASNTEEPKIYIEDKSFGKSLNGPMTADELEQLGEWLIDTAKGIKSDSDFKNK